MTDFIDGPKPPWASVKAIGAIDYIPNFCANILVSVDDPRRDHEQHGPVNSCNYPLTRQESGRSCSVVPQENPEVSWSDKSKTVGLVAVLMRAADNAGFRS